MKTTRIRGWPPWVARGTPVVKLRDGPALKIRGKPPFRQGMNCCVHECMNDKNDISIRQRTDDREKYAHNERSLFLFRLGGKDGKTVSPAD